jgi:hypothetical protein
MAEIGITTPQMSRCPGVPGSEVGGPSVFVCALAIELGVSPGALLARTRHGYEIAKLSSIVPG